MLDEILKKFNILRCAYAKEFEKFQDICYNDFDATN